MISLNFLKNTGFKSVNRSMLLVKKYSPEILTTVGIVGMIGTAVLASRATLKLAPIIENVQDEKYDLDHYAESKINDGTFDKKEHTRAVSKVYVDAAIDVSKLYGPTVTLGVGSVICIISAHGIMQRRAVAITAAYKALEATFVEYRKRVVEELGEEKEFEIRTNKKQVEIVDENGKTKKAYSVDPNGYSPYARFFDEYSNNWSKTPEYNFLFLRAQQNYANDLLHSRGHVFLNEVYDMLGIPRSQAGQVVGWTISKDGDNFIDFGLYDHDSPSAHAFVNGLESSILLDFNVDGVVYDRI